MEPLDVRPRVETIYPILEVRNPVKETRYRVLLPAYPSVDPALCDCTDFARRGLGTCKHIEAARRWIREHPETPLQRPRSSMDSSTDIWKEVDRRRAERAAQSPESANDLRSIGAVLLSRESPGAPSSRGPRERRKELATAKRPKGA
ncbi:MAG TPA: hypothetical protein VJS68_03665 [Thermoplasmata archaeon]|nr:hypothetical protein [Thermoplasmata archaeon]